MSIFKLGFVYISLPLEGKVVGEADRMRCRMRSIRFPHVL